MLNWAALAMGVQTKRLAAIALAAIFTVVAAACGDVGVVRPTTTPALTLTPTTSPATPTSSPTASPTPTARPTPIPTPPASAFGRLSSLTSYRYQMRWEGNGIHNQIIEKLCGRATPDPFILDVRGAIIAPDKVETLYKANCPQGEFTVIVINKQNWLKFPGGLVVGPTAFQGSPEDVNEAVGFWDGKVMRSGVPLGCAGEGEVVNGILTQHCRLTGATVQQLAPLFGVAIDQGRIINSSFDFWLHVSDGYPVRVRIALQGVDEKGSEFRVTADMDVTDVNSPTIQIQPPT